MVKAEVVECSLKCELTDWRAMESGVHKQGKEWLLCHGEGPSSRESAPESKGPLKNLDQVSLQRPEEWPVCAASVVGAIPSKLMLCQDEAGV